jgi:hypothetical protein
MAFEKIEIQFCFDLKEIDQGEYWDNLGEGISLLRFRPLRAKRRKSSISEQFSLEIPGRAGWVVRLQC